MLDSDRRFEELLRATLREEAASLPFTLTFEALDERRRARRRVGIPLRLALVAALLIAALAVAAAIALSLRQEVPDDPPPIPPPALTLPTTEQLLASIDDATVLLEAQRDPTTDPTPAADGRYVVGEVQATGAYVVSAACGGGGDLLVEVGTLEGGRSYLSTPVPCDGQPHLAPMEAAPGEPPQPVTVTAPASMSWVIAAGRLPDTLAVAPAFAPIEITPGWVEVTSAPPAIASGASTGAAALAPEGSTRLAAWVTCQGPATGTVTLGDQERPIDCVNGETVRLEIPAVGGTRYDASLTTDGTVWARLVLEADRADPIAYPSAPTLPADVAATPWAATGADLLTVGTVGSSTPTTVDVGPHLATVARDGLVAVPAMRDGEPAHLELVAVPEGTIIRTLATSSTRIAGAWLDTTNEQVIFVLQYTTGLEVHRIGLDGSDPHPLFDVPGLDATGELVSVTAELSLDDAVFVAEACRQDGSCQRTIVDTESHEVRTVDTSDFPMCSILGIDGSTIIGHREAQCGQVEDVEIVVADMDGGEGRVLSAAEGHASGLVRGDTGLVVISSQDDGATIMAVDVATDTARVLVPAAEGRFVRPLPVRLPDGWVLLGTSLTEDPAQTLLPRETPILVDVDSGERIDMVNLPHTVEPAP